MTGGDVWGVVLVKPFRLAKQRLGPVLSEAERIELARVMLEDVLQALDACTHSLAGVFVVTADEDAAAIAQRHNAMVIREAAATGMNAAIAEVIDRLSGMPDAGIVVVPADLPQISAIDVDGDRRPHSSSTGGGACAREQRWRNECPRVQAGGHHPSQLWAWTASTGTAWPPPMRVSLRRFASRRALGSTSIDLKISPPSFHSTPRLARMRTCRG